MEAQVDPKMEHAALVEKFTGGLAPRALTEFGGSNRLRPDGRPLADFRRELRKIPNRRNALSVLITLLTPVVVVTGYVQAGRWWLWPLAFILMGTSFPRYAIMNHEAAHRLLFSNKRINDAVGQRLFGLLGFSDGGDGYRRAHGNHHRDEFGPSEPDFSLYSRYPVPAASMRRKLVRDTTGRSAWKIIRPAVRGIFTGSRRSVWTFGAQLVIFGLFLAVGQPLLYLTLWVLPWATYWRVVNRLRALAEHGGMTRSKDRRATTHHVRQSLVSAFFFVPFNTGYHLAHHVDSGIPWRSLPVLHAALVEDGYMSGVTEHRSYRAFWRTLVK